MVLVESEQPESVLENIDWISGLFIDKDLNVKLFVSPVDLKKRLEASQERLCLVI